MTEDLAYIEKKEGRDSGLSWPRIAGISFAIALHAAALLLLLSPVAPPAPDVQKDDVVSVTFIEPPPPRPSPVPPPPDNPPVVLDTPRAVDVAAPPPSPPAPPAAVPDIGGSVDPSSRAMNPPRYPPSVARLGIQGTTMLIISIDASGNVLDVEVEKSAGNRELDRAAITAARKWRFNPEIKNGQKVASRVRVPVEWKLN